MKQHYVDTIFRNLEKSKTSKPYVLVLKRIDKVDLLRGEKSIALSKFSVHYTWKNINKNIGKNLNNNYSLKHLHCAKKFMFGAMKIASKRICKKLAEPTSDLIGNKVADKITSSSKKSFAK